MSTEIQTKLTPIEMAKLYNFPTGLTGKSQSIAIISLGQAINFDELKKDFTDLGVIFPDITEKGLKGASSGDSGPGVETHLDLEVVGSICPDAIITVYRAPLTEQGFAKAIDAAVEDDNDVISISWVMQETALSKDSLIEKALAKAQSKNITVCAAAGDGGSSNTLSFSRRAIPAKDKKAHVGYPASSPWVLSCGGTQMMENNRQRFEVVWNNAANYGGATGGGVSECFELPSWQKKENIDILSANNGATGRVIPDVSGLAAQGDWTIYLDNASFLSYGTSAVTPLWASLITLINEARGKLGKPRLGFVNPLLYSMKNKTEYFTEVSSGNNRPEPDYPGYDASSGFNACCGWGTPIGKNLFVALRDI